MLLGKLVKKAGGELLCGYFRRNRSRDNEACQKVCARYYGVLLLFSLFRRRCGCSKLAISVTMQCDDFVSIWWTKSKYAGTHTKGFYRDTPMVQWKHPYSKKKKTASVKEPSFLRTWKSENLGKCRFIFTVNRAKHPGQSPFYSSLFFFCSSIVSASKAESYLFLLITIRTTA